MISKKFVDYTPSIQVEGEVDVFIAGGGAAGVAAAVSAARCGCSVCLIEEQACLGGMGTAAMVPAFMMFTDGIHHVVGGIGEEIINTLRKSGGTGDDNGLSIKAEVLKRVYDELLLQEKVEFYLNTRLVDVIKSGSQVTTAVISGKSRLYAINAKVFIDCTGDGNLAFWAGAPFEKGDSEGNMMPGTLCSIWNGVDWSRVKAFEDDRYLEKAFANGMFSVEDRHLPGMWEIGGSLGGGNIGHAFGVDGTDEKSLTRALVEQRKRLTEYESYYKKYVEGFENIELAATGALLGIRESRRILGDYILNIEDFKNRAVFEDEIGRYCYPVDIHSPKADAENQKKADEDFRKNFRYEKGESYGIPYRSLVPLGLSNVLVAGRCISCDRYMQASIRVMPGCFITGQAAGTAAAMAARNSTGTREISIKMLQKTIKVMGGYLPNCE